MESKTREINEWNNWGKELFLYLSDACNYISRKQIPDLCYSFQSGDIMVFKYFLGTRKQYSSLCSMHPWQGKILPQCWSKFVYPPTVSSHQALSPHTLQNFIDFVILTPVWNWCPIIQTLQTSKLALQKFYYLVGELQLNPLHSNILYPLTLIWVRGMLNNQDHQRSSVWTWASLGIGFCYITIFYFILSL